MKCPKCGYNSFDHLDSCKKCGKDLIEYKQRFGIVSVLFPSQLSSADQAVTVAEESTVVVDAAVAAATATTAATAVTAVDKTAAAEPVSEPSREGDDFGFDFMGDSEEEEDLSFDELFEEAPADEDVEETLPAPEDEEPTVAGEDQADDFSFDLAGADQTDEEETVVSELDADFGFDPAADADPAGEAADESAETLESADFELPPAEEDSFSFDSDNVAFDVGEAEDTGVKEAPKDPFDLPEFSLYEKAPEQDPQLSVADSASAVIEEESLLLGELPVASGLDERVELSPAAVITEPVVEAVDASVEVVEVPPVEVFPSEESTSDRIDPVSDPGAAALQVPEPLGEMEADAADSHRDDSAAAISPAISDPVALEASEEPEEPVAGELENFSAEDLSADLVTGLLPTTGSRIIAFCCDLILLLLVGTSFVIAAEAAMSPTGDSLLPSLETLVDLSVPYFLVLFSLAFAYFTLFHFLVGQTPGKMLVGLRVETVTGEPLLFSQAFLRSVGGLLQLLPVGFGYLAVFFSPDQRGWNDRLAGTRLISLKDLPEEA